MEEREATRLLKENSRLISERDELSNVLYEEKEMVRYLHRVIKNYEHLLRSNSQRGQSRYQTKVHQNKPDRRMDLINEQSSLEPVSRTNKKVKMPSTRQDTVIECGGFFIKDNESTKLHNARQMDQLPNNIEDDMCLEDLELGTGSSVEQQDKSQKKEFLASSSSKDKESLLKKLHHKNTKEGIEHAQIRRTNDPTFKGDRTSLDPELQNLHQELDRIAKQLKRYQNSLAKSEKRLSKMDHRLEYLESLATGKESVYL